MRGLDTTPLYKIDGARRSDQMFGRVKSYASGMQPYIPIPEPTVGEIGMGGLGGAAAGASIGAWGGPPGAAAGAVIGGTMGVLSTSGYQPDWKDAATTVINPMAGWGQTLLRAFG